MRVAAEVEGYCGADFAGLRGAQLREQMQAGSQHLLVLLHHQVAEGQVHQLSLTGAHQPSVQDQMNA